MNTLNLKSDQHLISPYNNTAESLTEIMRTVYSKGRTTLFYNEALDEQWKEDEPRLIPMFQYYNINITETE